MNSIETGKYQPDSIREAQIEDVLGIINVQKKTWLSTYAGLGDISHEDIERIPFEKAEVDMVQEIVSNPNHKYFVATNHGNEVIGYCYVQKGREHTIKSLYVLKEYQGQHLGSAFITKAFDFLGDDQPIYVEVLALNTPALDFYSKFGFEEYGRRLSSRFLSNAGKQVEVVQMKRDISSTFGDVTLLNFIN